MTTHASPHQWCQSKFARELTLRVVSKVCLIISLLVVGMVIQPVKESYRSRQALKAQIEKKRFHVIAGTWEHLYQIEATTRDIMIQAAETGTKRKSAEKLAQAMPEIDRLGKKLSSESSAFKKYLQENRFWFDPPTYGRLVQHNNNHYKLIDTVMRDDISAYSELVPELNATRNDIYKYLGKFR